MGDYRTIALKARKEVLRMIHEAGTSHIGSNFSCIDILSVLYEIAKVDKGAKSNRDRIVYSKSWAAAAVYVFLANKGIIQKADLKKFAKPGQPYFAILEHAMPGMDFAEGSLGYGLPCGVGFALAKKLNEMRGRVFVIMSDGEQAIGTTWESALIAAHYRLNNLCVVVDYNKFQAMGATSEVLSIEPLRAKWGAFGWHVTEIDGHNYAEIERALRSPRRLREKPTVVIAHTVKGRGVSFMERKLEWHYKRVSDEDYRRALTELERNYEEHA